MIILSHRGNINGKESEKENTFPFLHKAIETGFNVEFDISFEKSKKNLVLSHDETEYTPDVDILSFFEKVHGLQFHALNIKNPFTVIEIQNVLKKYSIKNNFFFFDFELLITEIHEARFFMKAIQREGFKVAFRLSEKEKYYSEYLTDKEVKLLWLDEFETQWITPDHVKELKQNNKVTFYVSPELHGEKNMNVVQKRWEEMINGEISGICTDYPEQLQQFAGEKK